MMKVKVDKMKIYVTTRFRAEGSVLRETIKSGGVGVEMRSEISSTAPAERVAAPPPAGSVARVEVIEPPKPIVVPQGTALPLPDRRFAIDPRTGHVLHESGGGYVDPKTGQFIPR